MRFLKAFLIIVIASLSILTLPSIVPSASRSGLSPTMVSYNPAPANNLHAPLSSMGLIGVTNSRPINQSQVSPTISPAAQSGPQTIKQNALRFIIDNSYFPQSETTVAVDPNNPNHVVGGFNDPKYFFCPVLPSDCGSSASASLSGFTASADGGSSVAKSSDLPDFVINGTFLVSWGDPSVASSVDGNFFFASLSISPGSPVLGNGIMIAKSNANLFNGTVSCNTAATIPTVNPCWNAVLVFGSANFPVFSFEDKDRIAVDRNPSSPYYGSVYVGWDHFFATGLSASYLTRCDGNLVSCTMLSGGSQPPVSGNDPFVAWTTPIVDKNGNVHVAWCNFGTFITYGPVSCRMTTSPPGGTGFGPITDIVSYMGTGTTLPTDTVVIGWATEQFRIGAGLISVAADLSPASNNLYFTVQVCTAGHYYQFPQNFAPVLVDNPGNCGQSAVLFSRSTDGGSSWSSPTALSKPAVNDQPYVTVDSQTGTVFVVYYTTQYDQFDHRIDVVASISNNHGQNFHQSRVTSVSNEPNSDPNMYNYIVPNGFGGSFSLPQYGDYFEAAATGGTLWVLFTGNYAVEAGTFQTDPFLAVLNSRNM